jgi:hypothetical protein
MKHRRRRADDLVGMNGLFGWFARHNVPFGSKIIKSIFDYTGNSLKMGWNRAVFVFAL